jgi:hypothetical protein
MESNSEHWLDVDTLAAFNFCPNAGQIAFRRQNDIVERDAFRIPNLSYSPIFDQTKLLQKIVDLKVKLCVWAIVILAEIASVIYIAYLGQPLFAIVASLAAAPSLYYSYNDVEHLFKALKQWQEFKASLPVPLPAELDSPIARHWWSFVKLGFTPVFPISYRDESTQLMGRPWRILVHQGTGERIPVVQHIEQFGNVLTQQIASNNKLLLAACAKLVETHEATTVRWGVVVDSKSLNAFLVPLDRHAIEGTSSIVAATRDQLLSTRGRPFRLIEPKPSVCSFCPFGYPRAAGRPTVIEGKRLRPNYYFLYDVIHWKWLFECKRASVREIAHDEAEDDSEFFDSEFDDLDSADHESPIEFINWLKRSNRRSPARHCDCGDIFEWTPPHAYWKPRELKAELAYANWLDRQVT